MLVTQLETPALIADSDIISENMLAMSGLLSDTGLRLRPHYKSHKCLAIARRQMELGACGITCAKLSEAEDLADGGIEDILIANQIVDRDKIIKTAILAGKCRLTVCVDNPANAKMLSVAAVIAGTVIHVLVEYEMGMRRCGVSDPEEYLELARLVISLPGLQYDGIQAYSGHISHIADEAERIRMTEENEDRLRSLIALLGQKGIDVKTVSGGSTGTAVIKAERGLYTELQAGSYFFMDSTYGKLGGLPFRNSLFVLATVISVRDGLVILDAGVKSIGTDQDDPWILHMDGTPVCFEKAETNEEHLKLFGPDCPMSLGDKLLIIPGHCCSTVNLHEKLYLFSGDKITDRLCITARGKSR